MSQPPTSTEPPLWPDMQDIQRLETDCPDNELLNKIRKDLAKIFLERENALRSNTELRKLCKAAYHALSSIIAHRDGIPTPTLQDLADKLNAAAGGVEA